VTNIAIHQRPIAMSPAEKTAAVTRVRCLERELFDDARRIRRGTSLSTAAQTVALINGLRRRLGWLEIDLDGGRRWPAPPPPKPVKGAKQT
jgi:hypothetical protein